jgi:hypothetical protein
MYHTIKDLIGKRFGKLLVVADSGERNNHREVIWSCLCDCGKECKKTSSTLSANKSRSCGCNRSEPKPSLQKKRIDDAPQRQSFTQYRVAAKSRGYTFNLTLEQFKNICSLDCFYCGSSPSMVKRTKYDSISMNGVDRKDNVLGYESSNCVPCCDICNRMKHTLSVEEFVQHIEKVYHSSRQSKTSDHDAYRGTSSGRVV